MIKLKPLIKESLLQDAVSWVFVNAAVFVITYVIRSLRSSSEYRSWKQEPHIKWLDRLRENQNFNKYVYYTIKNDNKIKDFEKKLKDFEKVSNNDRKKSSLEWDKFQYTKELVDKWLDSNPAQEELKKVFKEIHPDKNENSRDIPSGYLTLTYKQWIAKVKAQTSKEWRETLDEYTTKRLMDDIAKKYGLPTT